MMMLASVAVTTEPAISPVGRRGPPLYIARNSPSMHSLLGLMLLTMAGAVDPSEAVAPVEYKLGDLVVAVRDSTLRVRRDGRVQVTDNVFPGVTMRIGAMQGRWLWVSNGIPGWIDRQEVIPLDSAVDYFTEMIDRYPNLAKWRYARAVAWTNKGELDIAIADYNELIKLRQSPAFYHVRGICHHSKGDYDKAISDFNEAIRLDPKSARYYNSRALAWLEQEEYDRAIDDAQRAIRINPNLASAYTNRGRAYQARGDIGLAIEDFKKCVQLDPNYPLGFMHYAWILATSPEARQRDADLALKYAERACKLTNWEDGTCLGTLAAAYAEAGNFDEAVKWETKAREFYPESAQEKWKFLLDLYQTGKPYRQGAEGPSE
jgi:Flp pilus assembly protein TadD